MNLLLSADHGTAKALRRHFIYRTQVCGPCLDWQARMEQDAAASYMARFRRRTALLPFESQDVKDHSDAA